LFRPRPTVYRVKFNESGGNTLAGVPQFQRRDKAVFLHIADWHAVVADSPFAVGRSRVGLYAK